MAIIEPIYSIQKENEVYHNNSECTERNNIETKNVRAGTGGKRLCEHCNRLNAANNYTSSLLFGRGGINPLFEAMSKKKV